MSSLPAALRFACVTLLVTAGCGLTDVGDDPTTLDEPDVANPLGATMTRRAAYASLRLAVGDGAVWSGLLADELFADTPFPGVNRDEQIDRRQSVAFEVSGGGTLAFPDWIETRVKAADAIRRFRAYAPSDSGVVGELFALRGFADVNLAEETCPGFALNEVVDGRIVYGPALTNEQVFQAALVEFDSALAFAGDSISALHLAQVGRGRALLGLGRYAEAAQAVAAVPSDFAFSLKFVNTSPAFQPNAIQQFVVFLQGGVADREGGNGLDYLSAADPRITATEVGTAVDGVTPLYAFDKYPDDAAPMVLASGLEARLIEAEAALDDGGDWLGILNALRADPAAPPGLDPLVDPGTADARVDLLFRERAFWLFLTGHRLGDLRRLIAHYGRAADAVFPTGAYRLGGIYDTGTSLPFPSVEESINPNVTSCTSR
ncbi:MAG TPA: hypothetical protein VJQ46_01035 [Gemmatimonadales bacterium]|nr:hypothetical protein [Gemmatimonadales bacterium]